MKYIITETQSEKLYEVIQRIINSSLEEIREDSEDWGLGEMDELNEVDAIDDIEVIRIEKNNKLHVYVNILINQPRYDFDFVIKDIQYRTGDYIPNMVIHINKIIDDRTFGPGIDW